MSEYTFLFRKFFILNQWFEKKIGQLWKISIFAEIPAKYKPGKFSTVLQAEILFKREVEQTRGFLTVLHTEILFKREVV